MDLLAVPQFLSAFYRLTVPDPEDAALVLHGEQENDVAYTFLTRGCRSAQRWMLRNGYQGWRKRQALSFTDSSLFPGARHANLPPDFLRAIGDGRDSALSNADGRPWGVEGGPHQDGNCYFIDSDKLVIARRAQPPEPLYLAYHYRHPAWDADVQVDFPIEARSLIVAEAADAAKEDNWLPGGPEMEQKIARALARARDEARDVARVTKKPRQLRAPRRYGNRW